MVKTPTTRKVEKNSHYSQIWRNIFGGPITWKEAHGLGCVSCKNFVSLARQRNDNVEIALVNRAQPNVPAVLVLENIKELNEPFFFEFYPHSGFGKYVANAVLVDVANYKNFPLSNNVLSLYDLNSEYNRVLSAMFEILSRNEKLTCKLEPSNNKYLYEKLQERNGNYMILNIAQRANLILWNPVINSSGLEIKIE